MTLRALLTAAAETAAHRVFLDGPAALTRREALARIAAREAELRRAGAGRPLVVHGENSSDLLLWVLAALTARVPVVLVPATFTGGELRAIAQLASACAVVSASGLEWLTAATPVWPEAAALAFATSGSTGAPRLALRSEKSLLDEGERYQRLLAAGADDVFMAAMPVAHAFAFGAAVMGSLVAGGRLICEHFTAPRQLAARVASGVTILPMVAAVARSLAYLDNGGRVESRLRVAMVGAGPVNAQVSRDFEAKWGVPLSSNYGSSETGATLARLSGEGTGRPMPGVECAIEGGQLWVKLASPPLGHLTPRGYEPVRLAPGGYYATGDIATRGEDGVVTIVGRLGDEIRRGGHTIVPSEIAAVIEACPGVAEVVVRGASDATGEQTVEAHVAPRPGTTLDRAELLAHVRARLAPHKRPTRWVLHDALPRTWSGKPVVRETTTTPAWMRSLLSYRLPAAIFAAAELGILERLPAAAADLAEGCDPRAVAMLLEVLEVAGVVRRRADRVESLLPSGAFAHRMIELERHLAGGWLSPDEIARAARGQRRFEHTDTSDTARLYREVICGPAQVQCAAQLGRTLPPWARVAEIGRGIGALSRMRSGQRCPLGPGPAILCDADDLPAQTWDEISLPPRSFDLVLVFNGIHWLEPAKAQSVLRRLLDALTETGALVIADIFLPEGDEGDDRTPLLLDWLTHGGTSFLRRSSLEQALTEAGGGFIQREAIVHPFESIRCLRAPQRETTNSTLA
ncbi:uncharacterized protein SOCEGT47_074500 [Sorangium cellulosum]|uniref:AMP-dependent synthetase/ligase domain-containing protein n=1 Tax=Sorangium cellulosum TaxID=56 RepID=A0A4P2QB26_SORCE|nr:AMP-binding protein [Sorangium cellulosum]AUX26880.1 uncharacterized protein SOCEGT47_074500 [Sorangium cellulosum]